MYITSETCHSLTRDEVLFHIKTIVHFYRPIQYTSNIIQISIILTRGGCSLDYICIYFFEESCCFTFVELLFLFGHIICDNRLVRLPKKTFPYMGYC